MSDNGTKPTAPDYLNEGSAGLHKRLHLMASLLNVAIGLIVFVGFMLLDRVLSWPAALIGGALLLLGLPLVGFVMPRIHKRFEKDLFRLLDRIRKCRPNLARRWSAVPLCRRIGQGTTFADHVAVAWCRRDSGRMDGAYPARPHIACHCNRYQPQIFAARVISGCRNYRTAYWIDGAVRVRTGSPPVCFSTVPAGRRRKVSFTICSDDQEETAVQHSFDRSVLCRSDRIAFVSPHGFFRKRAAGGSV